MELCAQPPDVLFGELALAAQNVGDDALGAEDIEQIFLTEVTGFIKWRMMAVVQLQERDRASLHIPLSIR